RAAHVEVGHLPFDREHEALVLRRGDLARPVVEVGRADRQAVALEQRRHAHRRLAAVAEAVEADPLAVHERQRVEPAQDLPVLRPRISSSRTLRSGATSLAKTSADCSLTRYMRKRSPFGARVRISVVLSSRKALRVASPPRISAWTWPSSSRTWRRWRSFGSK